MSATDDGSPLEQSAHAGCLPDLVRPAWVGAIKDGSALIKRGMALLEGGPLEYYLEKATGTVEYLLTRFSPFKVGDAVKLTATPEINEKVAWGWQGSKHFLKEGASGVVVAVDCDRDGLIFDVVMDNQTYVYGGEEKPVSQPKSFRFRERWIRRANDQALPPA